MRWNEDYYVHDLFSCAFTRKDEHEWLYRNKLRLWGSPDFYQRAYIPLCNQAYFTYLFNPNKLRMFIKLSDSNSSVKDNTVVMFFTEMWNSACQNNTFYETLRFNAAIISSICVLAHFWNGTEYYLDGCEWVTIISVLLPPPRCALLRARRRMEFHKVSWK